MARELRRARGSSAKAKNERWGHGERFIGGGGRWREALIPATWEIERKSGGKIQSNPAICGGAGVRRSESRAATWHGKGGRLGAENGRVGGGFGGCCRGGERRAELGPLS